MRQRFDRHAAELLGIPPPTARRTKAEALAQEHHRIPELTSVEQRLAPPPWLVEAEVEPDRRQPLRLCGCRDNRLPVRHGGGQRLLTVDVLPRFETGDNLFPVGLRRGADQDHIGGIDHLTKVSGRSGIRELREPLGARHVRVSAGREADAAHVPQRPCMLSRYVPRTYESDPQRRVSHVRPLLLRHVSSGGGTGKCRQFDD